MKNIMKNTLAFLFGMAYCWGIGIVVYRDISEMNFLTALLAMVILSLGTIVIIANILLFLEEAWKKG